MTTDPTTPEGAAHVARLARLALSPQELSEAAKHFQRMLAYVAELQQLDLDGVEATAAGRGAPLSALRPDRPGPSLPPAVALGNAPRGEPEGFVVPPVLGGEE